MADGQIDRFEWTFSPGDLFEDDHEIEREAYILRFSKGKISADVNADYFNEHPEIRTKIQHEIQMRIDAATVISPNRPTLSESSRRMVFADGRTVNCIEPKTGHIVWSGHRPEIGIATSESTIFDSPGGRIGRTRRIADRCSAHQDDHCLGAMLAGVNSANNHPDHALVHLYEVRDAAQKRFCRAERARRTIGISKSRWDDLGDICNHLPLNQGRHRGKHEGELRNATGQELELARQIVQEIIEGYLDHLERAGNG